MKDVPFEWIQYLVNTGLGFLVVAGMITWGVILWLKRRNGKSTGLALVQDQAHSPAVLYHMMDQVAQDVKDHRDDLRRLSEVLSKMHEETRLYYQATERSAARRHGLTKSKIEEVQDSMLASMEVLTEVRKRMSA